MRRALTLAAIVAVMAAAAHAQPTKVARVGYLSPLSAGADAPNREAFRAGLAALGRVEGRDVVVVARYAGGNVSTLPALARELVAERVDLIVTAATPSARAARDATRTVPIVMAFAGSPDTEGIVASLARPGGNVTGLSANVVDMQRKRVELLREAVPRLRHLALIVTPETTSAMVEATEATGRALGLRVTTIRIRGAGDIERAFGGMRAAGVDGVVVDLLVRDHTRLIVDLATAQALPTVSGPREFAAAGGLMAYGPDYPDLFRRAATYVDKVLRGTMPGTLAVELPTKYALVVNASTARALQQPIAPAVLARADEVLP